MTQSAPEFKVLQSIAFLAVVLQSSLLYTMNQGNVLLEQSLIMGMLFNLAKFSAPAFIFIVGFHLIRHYTKQLVYKEYISEKATHLLIPYFFWSILYLLTTNDIMTLQGGIKFTTRNSRTASLVRYYDVPNSFIIPFTMHTILLVSKTNRK